MLTVCVTGNWSRTCGLCKKKRIHKKEKSSPNGNSELLNDYLPHLSQLRGTGIYFSIAKIQETRNFWFMLFQRKSGSKQEVKNIYDQRTEQRKSRQIQEEIEGTL